MTISLLNTAGFDEAFAALNLSYGRTPPEEEAIFQGGFAACPSDIKLLERLVKKGDSHAKVTRMIDVWLDITAPRYWWAEFDTYKVGTTAMSESTMHTLTKRELTSKDFEDGENLPLMCIGVVNTYIEDKDLDGAKKCLPESFLQRRIVKTNYQTLRHMYFDRKHHKLSLWSRTFVDFIKTLPFHTLITIGE